MNGLYKSVGKCEMLIENCHPLISLIYNCNYNRGCLIYLRIMNGSIYIYRDLKYKAENV